MQLNVSVAAKEGAKESLRNVIVTKYSAVLYNRVKRHEPTLRTNAFHFVFTPYN